MLSYYRKRKLRRKLKRKTLLTTAAAAGSNQKSAEVLSVYQLLSYLEEAQLENLLLAIDTHGGSADCVKLKDTVVVNNNNNRLQETTSTDNSRNHCYELAMCKAYRWPDLRNETHVRRLPFCNACYSNICLNPFHFSKVIGMC